MATIQVRREFTLGLDLGEMYCIQRAMTRYRDYLGDGHDPPGDSTSQRLLTGIEVAIREATRD